MATIGLVLLNTAPALGFSAAYLPRAAVRPAPRVAHAATMMAVEDIERKTGDNVEQIKDTQRDKVMTFSYDMSIDTG